MFPSVPRSFFKELTDMNIIKKILIVIIAFVVLIGIAGFLILPCRSQTCSHQEDFRGLAPGNLD